MKGKNLDFIPECYIDTSLIESLMDVHVNHQYSCSKVTLTMERFKTDRFAVGIIDDDKKKPSYLDSFAPVASKGHLKLYRHKEKPHYIICLSPASEKFIIDCAKASNINLSDFGLSTAFADFKAQTKKVTSKEDKRFKLLSDALKANEEFRRLSNVLSYLSENTYGSSIHVLEDMFK